MVVVLTVVLVDVEPSEKVVISVIVSFTMTLSGYVVVSVSVFVCIETGYGAILQNVEEASATVAVQAYKNVTPISMSQFM